MFFQKEYVKNCPEGWIKNKKLPKYAKRLNFMQEFWTTIYDNYILRALFFYIYSIFFANLQKFFGPGYTAGLL